jgi:hypothetical protein
VHGKRTGEVGSSEPPTEVGGSKHPLFGKASARVGGQSPALVGAGLPRRTNVHEGSPPPPRGGLCAPFHLEIYCPWLQPGVRSPCEKPRPSDERRGCVSTPLTTEARKDGLRFLSPARGDHELVARVGADIDAPSAARHRRVGAVAHARKDVAHTDSKLRLRVEL